MNISNLKKKFHVAVCVSWVESERGWGCRPDGYSFHLSEKDAEQYIKRYWEQMPDDAPDEYSRPNDNGNVSPVSDEIFAEIEKCANKCGIRYWQSEIVKKDGGVYYLSWELQK